MAEKMRENTFDFNDFIDQMDQVQKMGPLDQIIKMIPGLGNNPALKNIQIPEKQIAHIKANLAGPFQLRSTCPPCLRYVKPVDQGGK